MDDVPLALLAFQGRLLAGVGKSLRIYDIGKKKLLRKVENKVHSHVTSSFRACPNIVVDFHNGDYLSSNTRISHHCR